MKYRNETLGYLFASLIVIIGALLMVGVVHADTPTPEPAPRLTYSKSAAVDGHYVEWTISVTNSGDADSNSQTVQDTLPTGSDWVIVKDTIGCELVPSLTPGRVKLDCNRFIVPKRDLTGVDTDGIKFVTIGGIVDKCGEYSNAALFNFVIVRATVINIPCPATPTPIPATPTPTMGITTTNTPNPTQPTSTPTSTPTMRIVPLPPNTGNYKSEPQGVAVGTYDIVLVSSVLVLSGLAVMAFGSRRRRK